MVTSAGNNGDAGVLFPGTYDPLLYPWLEFLALLGTTVPTDGIEFVDKNDARRLFLGLVKHIADTGCANTDKHLDEVGTGNCKEGNPGFAGDGPRQQRLTGTRRPLDAGRIPELWPVPKVLAIP